MDLERLKEIIEENGWTIEEVSFGGNDKGLELFKYSPAGEDFSFVVNSADDPNEIIKNIFEYEDEYDPNEHMSIWVENAGQNGTPDLMTLAEDAKDIGKMIEELADAIRAEQNKPISELVDNENKIEEIKETKLQEDDEDTDKELEKIDEEENEALDNLIQEWEDKNPLYERVISEIVDDSENYDGTKLERIKLRLDDISHGLVTGIVSSLVYYSDTVAFFDKYYDDIYDYIDYLSDAGLEPLEAIKNSETETEILMGTDSVKNRITWMVYEEIAYEFGEALENL